jgi:hypothetical protein
MHFLSHYYTEIPDNSPLFVAGLIIPDLAPHFSKAYNQRIKQAALPNNLAIKAVQLGVLRHFEGDKKFHNSGLFNEHITLCVDCFVKVGLDRTRLRLSALAHIAVEMLIDRQIVVSHEDVCNDFYRHIDNATEDDLIAFFNYHSLEEQKSGFLPRFRFFKQRRFLYLFKELQNVVVGLDRVYGSVTHTEFTGREREQFLAAFRNMDAIIRYSWQEILNV